MAATIEELITALTAAVKANTAALVALAAGKPASGTANTGKPASGTAAAPAAGKSKYTIDQVKAIAVKVKEEIGEDEAKSLIKKHGGGNLQELGTKKGVWDKFVAEAEKMLADATTSEDSTGDADPDENDGL